MAANETDLFTFNSKVRSYIIPRLSETLEGHPISTWDVQAMGIIHDYPGCNMKTICCRIAADKGRMTNLVKNLIAKGMVENRSKRKSYCLYLTEVGHDEYHYAKARLDELNDELRSGLTERQRETLEKLLQKITVVTDEGYRYR